ncbi:MAG: hypothetical protein JW765_09410 [Deltaproteobacteria bacterium]|nr:hypothetical protein [Candidatus Zymogenaceae bacterium]
MNRIIYLSVFALLIFGVAACAADDIVITTRADAVGHEITLSFEKGEHYTHPLKINRLITIKTTPQVAVWIEDLDGNYIETLYVTKKSGTQGWRSSPDLPAGSIRRPESLPCWSHKRGVVYPDGLFMPTRDNPVTDAVTAASPAGDFHLKTKAPQGLRKFVVLAEVNNSADFNDAYPAEAPPGTPGYSGGRWGSGQPSIVYSATVDLSSGSVTGELKLGGHGSPDGTDGGINPDLSGLTTAKDIVKRITVTAE